MYGDILRRKPLLDDAPHLVLGDRAERRVVAIEEGESHVLVAEEERGARVGRVTLAEAEEAFVGALARHDVLERDAEVFALAALDFELPFLAARLQNVERQLSLPARLEAEVEIVAHRLTVDAHHAVTRLQLQLSAEALGRDFGDGDPASPDLRDRWCDGKFVHLEKLDCSLKSPSKNPPPARATRGAHGRGNMPSGNLTVWPKAARGSSSRPARVISSVAKEDRCGRGAGGSPPTPRVSRRNAEQKARGILTGRARSE